MAESGRRNCPACGGTRRMEMGSKNGFEILACVNCGTLYTGALPKGGETEDYDEYYSDANLSVPGFIEERVREIVRGFGEYRQNNRFLDVGFGAGTILDVAAEEGWNVFGLEVSKPAVEQARARGYEVFHGALRDANYPADCFDVVTASEILEHLDSPHEDLKEIARILRPGGLFWATTPSSRGMSARIMGLDWSVLSPPEHTKLYSKHGLAGMLAEAGFKISAIRAYGTNPFEIINHFRAAPAGAEFSRVQTAYALNENLTKSPLRKIIKRVLNFSLDITGLGDSLKIYATKG